MLLYMVIAMISGSIGSHLATEHCDRSNIQVLFDSMVGVLLGAVGGLLLSHWVESAARYLPILSILKIMCAGGLSGYLGMLIAHWGINRLSR